MYRQMTLALMRCEFVDVICLFIYFYYYYYYFFFSSFPHGVFIVRKLTVISIATVGPHVISIFLFFIF